MMTISLLRGNRRLNVKDRSSLGGTSARLLRYALATTIMELIL